ncbi:hypothetical protein AYI69_g10729, partial [Smittium culicis]
MIDEVHVETFSSLYLSKSVFMLAQKCIAIPGR